MMTPDLLAKELTHNKKTLLHLLETLPFEMRTWSLPKGWSATIIIAHLLDEEVEDFRTRLRMTSEEVGKPWPSIDPEAWVSERGYASKNFDLTLQRWKEERDRSIKWLEGIPSWNAKLSYEHPHFGTFTLNRLACNWLAHDLLHIKQLVRLKYDYLAQSDTYKLNYAGTWT